MGHTTAATSTPLPDGYCTYEDIDNTIHELSDLTPVGKTLATWVADNIAFADKEIDGRLGGKYVVPFSPVPDLIAELSRLLTCSNCLRGNFVGTIPNDSRLIDYYRQTAEKLMKEILDGTVLLTDATAVTDGSSSIVVSSDDKGRDFTQTKYDTNGNVLSVGSLEGI
jgi:phage gp36-like protein